MVYELNSRQQQHQATAAQNLQQNQAQDEKAGPTTSLTAVTFDRMFNMCEIFQSTNDRLSCACYWTLGHMQLIENTIYGGIWKYIVCIEAFCCAVRICPMILEQVPHSNCTHLQSIYEYLKRKSVVTSILYASLYQFVPTFTTPTGDGPPRGTPGCVGALSGESAGRFGRDEKAVAWALRLCNIFHQLGWWNTLLKGQWSVKVMLCLSIFVVIWGVLVGTKEGFEQC